MNRMNYRICIYLMVMIGWSCSLEKIDQIILPQACFTFSVVTEPCVSECAVGFNASCSREATSYSWNFGDGTTSQDASPSHIYQEPGTYQVRLEVTNSSGRSDTTATITIGAQPMACFEFIAPTEACNASCMVTFDASCSQGAESYLWDFGDGNNGSGRTTSHNYESSGSFRTLLTITSGDISDTLSKMVNIVISDPCEEIPNFTPSNQSLPSPVTVNFNLDLEVSDHTFAWEFGDGGKSTEQNPMHSFGAVAVTTNREVSLTVSTMGSNCFFNSNVTLYNGPIPNTNFFTYLSESNVINNVTTQGNDLLEAQAAQSLDVKDIEIDYENRLLYLLTSNTIYTANLNGTQIKTLFNTVDLSISNQSMFIDFSNKMIYWTSLKDNTGQDVSGVYRADMNGGGKEELLTNKFRQFDEIVVDHENQVFFIIVGGDINNEQSENTVSLIKYSLKNLAEAETLIYTGDIAGSISGLCLDVNNQQIYYSISDGFSPFILRKGAVEKPAATFEILAENASERPIHDIVYDSNEDMIYWSSYFDGQYRIERVSGSGANRKPLIEKDVNDRTLAVGLIK